MPEKHFLNYSRILARWGSRSLTNESISVVIVSHNRVSYIRPLLLSLANQSRPPDEVVIVDDASKEPIVKHITDIVDLLQKKSVKVKVYRTVREIGLGAARSLGAKLAQGDIIVFLDDDVILGSNTIATYVKVYTSLQCDIMAGLCLPLYLCDRNEYPKWWDERVLGGIIAVRNDIAYLNSIRPEDYVYGCNFAVAKRVFESLKGFKPWLGRIKGTLLSGEEWDFVARAVKKGFKVCFVARAIAYHLIPPTKLHISRVWKMAVGIGKTRCILSYEGILSTALSRYLLLSAIAIFKDLDYIFINLIRMLLRKNAANLVKGIYNIICHLTTIFACKSTLLEIKPLS